MFRNAFTSHLVFAVPSSSPMEAVDGPYARRQVAPSISSAPGLDSKEVVFRRLFDEYWRVVRRHLDCYIDDHHEVDELTAEVFVVAWRKLNPRQPMGLVWFLRTTENKLRDRTRRSRSRDRALDALTRGLTNSEAKLDELDAIALRAAIRSLNARERQVVVLTYWDGLTAGEIAGVLRTSQNAVWTTLARARAKLRVQLEGGARA